MTTGDDRSVKVGGNITGAQVVTGDHNKAVMREVSVQLTSGDAVNIGAEIASLRQALAALDTPDQGKIDRAIADAEDELAKPEPDRDEVGSAVERAVKYAKGASDFSDHVSNIAKHLGPVVSWLGAHWKGILLVAGIAF